MPSKDADTAASPLRVFGAMLRFYRSRAGMSLDQLGRLVYMSGDMIGKIEAGHRTPSEQLVEALEALPDLATGGALAELRDTLRDHLKQRPYPGWFADWLDKEARAVTLRSFQPLLVPGLLQTEDYARAILRTRVGDTEAEVEAMVTARMERQAILTRDKPPMLWVLLDEGVLRRPAGGRKVMAAQLRALAKAARQPSIVLEVIPGRTGAHQGLNGGAFVLADFAEDDGPTAGYQDTAVAGQIVESPDDIRSLVRTWDTLRSEALPRSTSLELLEELAQTWTT
jgi:transcriptional regulator with XRE-family HTH domain